MGASIGAERTDAIGRARGEQTRLNAEQEHVDLRNFPATIRQCTDIKELTPALVNRLISKIEVYDSYKDENGKKRVPINVHFVGTGVIQPPDVKTIREAQEEIRNSNKIG